VASCVVAAAASGKGGLAPRPHAPKGAPTKAGEADEKEQGPAERTTAGSPAPPRKEAPASRDGNGADTDTIQILLVGYPHFLSDTNSDSNIIEYECKMNNLNSHSDIYSIYR
jgi:hypothetical protein